MPASAAPRKSATSCQATMEALPFNPFNDIRSETPMPDLSLTAQELAHYHADGYVLRRGLFDAEEVALMAQAIATDPAIARNTYARRDGQGAATELALW